MGSWFELRVGATTVSYGSNHLDRSALLPFQRSDVRCRTSEGQDCFRFEAPALVVGRRLDLLGHTIARSRADYAKSLPWARGSFQGYDWPASLSEWQHSVTSRAARMDSLRHEPGWSLDRRVWEETLLGFPGGGLLNVLRALVDTRPDEAVVLDLTDLAEGGWLDEDGSFLSPSGCREPLIILTEGKTDSRYLGAALDVLFPEYAEFIRFMDYDGVKVAGGVPEVVGFVKRFASCGIPNRIVALFDNDTAGRDALGQLGDLAQNIFPMCLPPLPMFASYPTEGPDGASISNIDGRACAIELYMGRHALTGDSGQLRPVRWTTHVGGGRYQGEVIGKDKVQEVFAESLATVRKHPARRSEFDFSGVEAIFEAIIAAVASR